MATQCAAVASALNAVLSARLPINPTENDSVDFKPADLIDSLEKDAVSAPLSLAACDVAVAPSEASVCAGQPAVFKLGPTGPIPLPECIRLGNFCNAVYC